MKFKLKLPWKRRDLLEIKIDLDAALASFKKDITAANAIILAKLEREFYNAYKKVKDAAVLARYKASGDYYAKFQKWSMFRRAERLVDNYSKA